MPPTERKVRHPTENKEILSSVIKNAFVFLDINEHFVYFRSRTYSKGFDGLMELLLYILFVISKNLILISFAFIYIFKIPSCFVFL